MMEKAILPPAMLGILGGGQLGRMFVVAAKTMGYRVTVLDPDAHAPAAAFADRHLCAAFDDAAALADLAQTCVAVTTEFENVNADSMRFLAEKITVSPAAEHVAIAQNRILEKRALNAAGLRTAPFIAIESAQDFAQASAEFFPAILKTACLGYDGKGQQTVLSAEDLPQAFAQLGSVPCVLEKRLALAKEISVVVARGQNGEARAFPIAENVHVNGILDISSVPADISSELAQAAQTAALRLVDSLAYVGVLAVEFFVLQDGALLVNEVAPRPHNSGHYTLDACVTDQFQQQVRALCRLPLGATDLQSAAAMVNILGDVWRDACEPNWGAVLAHEASFLHLYGKTTPRKGRKMGHFTVLSDTPARAIQIASQLRQQL